MGTEAPQLQATEARQRLREGPTMTAQEFAEAQLELDAQTQSLHHT